MNQQATVQRAMTTESANHHFKTSFSAWFWGSTIAATAAHFGFFAWLEFGEPPDVSLNTTEIPIIHIPPEVDIPVAPDPIVRPATPVVTDAVIDTDITIARVTFDENPVGTLEPPAQVEVDISSAPGFTPRTVEPAYINADEVLRALEREYPPLLRDAGIGGTVKVWFFIDENGVVQNQLVMETSGHEALDAAALRVAPVFRFTPALNREKAVPVWVALPITFRAN